MPPWSAADVARVWDARAGHYLELFRDELHDKPADLRELDAFASRVGAGARVCDVGCGPCGHVTAHLASRGVEAYGVDLSPRCVKLARGEHHALRFDVADQREVEGPLDGIVSWYSLHDQPRAEVASVIAAWAAVLAPGGQLLIAAKLGPSDGLVRDPLGSDLEVWWAEHDPLELEAAVAQHFSVDSIVVRGAYAGEIVTDRIYLRATR